jgi:hypothetical protein
MDTYRGAALGVESAWPAFLDGYAEKLERADPVATATRLEPSVMLGLHRDRKVRKALSTEEKVST